MNAEQAIYPTIILIIITLQKSHVEHQFSYPLEVISTAENMSFAVPRSGNTGICTGMQTSTHSPTTLSANAKRNVAVLGSDGKDEEGV